MVSLTQLFAVVNTSPVIFWGNSIEKIPKNFSTQQTVMMGIELVLASKSLGQAFFRKRPVFLVSLKCR